MSSTRVRGTVILKDQKVVIAGAGQAAGTVVASLTQWGYEGPIVVVGDEPAPPYQRPPLSKTFLKGLVEEWQLYLKPASFYDTATVALRAGSRVEEIRRHDKAVLLDDGDVLAYDKLVIATGARPRPLVVNGAHLRGVLSLRTLSDVTRLRALAVEGRRLVVIGAGYIGLEAASVARDLGLDVTVVEVTDRVLSRVTSPVVSEFYEGVHRRAGVRVRLGAKVTGFLGRDDHVGGVELDDGEVLPADIVLMGIGIVPNDELASAAGLSCDDGINTDSHARTSDPDIYAIGDCANRVLVHYGFRGRLESVHNAIETGKIAAASLCEKPPPRPGAPWFWSDQYDLKLQTAGVFLGYDAAIVRGDLTSHSFSVWYLKDSRFLAVDAVNAPAAFAAGKALVGKEVVLDPVRIGDDAIPIKDIVSEALTSPPSPG